MLLLDEPLGALDLKLRQEMQIELKSLQREVGITFLFVTHDQEEALTMSDRIAVFNDGRIEQVGTPGEIYEQPDDGVRRRVRRHVQPDSRGPGARAARDRRGRDAASGEDPHGAAGNRGGAGRVRDRRSRRRRRLPRRATRYLVELDAGIELAVVEQNLDKTASSVLAAKGQQVQLIWAVDAPRAVSTDGETGSNEPTATEVAGNA